MSQDYVIFDSDYDSPAIDKQGQVLAVTINDSQNNKLVVAASFEEFIEKLEVQKVD